MDSRLESKWKALKDIIIKMISMIYRERPTCAQVLSQFNSWNITISEVEESDKYQKNVNQMRNLSNKFFYNYFQEMFAHKTT